MSSSSFDPGDGRYGTVTVTFPGVDGEDATEVHIERAKVSINHDSNYVFGSGRTWFEIDPVRAPGVNHLYLVKEISGDITKGAQALYVDKHPDSDLPYLGGRATTELAKRLRRKAKAVLDAVKA